MTRFGPTIPTPSRRRAYALRNALKSQNLQFSYLLILQQPGTFHTPAYNQFYRHHLGQQAQTIRHSRHRHCPYHRHRWVNMIAQVSCWPWRKIRCHAEDWLVLLIFTIKNRSILLITNLLILSYDQDKGVFLKYYKNVNLTTESQLYKII